MPVVKYKGRELYLETDSPFELIAMQVCANYEILEEKYEESPSIHRIQVERGSGAAAVLHRIRAYLRDNSV